MNEEVILMLLFTDMSVLMMEIVRWSINLLIEQEEVIVMLFTESSVGESLLPSQGFSNPGTYSGSILSTIELSCSSDERLGESK